MDTKVGLAPSELISEYISGLTDWRGPFLDRLRKLIHEVAPDITEEWKWDTPIFSQKGNIIAVAAFKDHVKLNFFKGALLDDPAGLFNAGLDAKTSRAIDFSQSDKVNEAALKDLVRAAVAMNTSGSKKK
jgi:hypothetical protein